MLAKNTGDMNHRELSALAREISSQGFSNDRERDQALHALAEIVAEIAIRLYSPAEDEESDEESTDQS